MARLVVGKKVPAFSFVADDGSTVSKASLAGERYVLYFYPADDTPGCTKEACQFNDLLSAFRAAEVKVFGVSPDSADTHLAFKKKYGLAFTLLTDASKTVMEKFGAFGEKMNYGKTYLGVIRSTVLVGPTGTIENVWYGVRADGHAAKVLSALNN